MNATSWKHGHDVDSTRLNLQLDRLLKGQQRVELALEEVHLALERLHGTHPPLGVAPGIRQAPTKHVRSNDATPELEKVASLHASRLGIELGGGVRRKSRFSEDVAVEIPAADLSTPVENKTFWRSQRSTASVGTRNSDSADVDNMAAATTTTLIHAVNSIRPVAAVMQPALQQIDVEVTASGYSGVQDFIRQSVAARMTKQSQLSSGTDLTHWSPMQTMQKLAFHPASSLLPMLDMLRCIFLFVDAIIVPFRIAWQEEETRSSRLLALVSLIFWILDIVFNFRTGFVHDGIVVTKTWPMAKRYVRGGFLLDLAVVASDTVDLVRPDLGVTSSLRQLAIKMVRIVRTLVKLRTGLMNRIETAMFYWMQVHALARFEHLVMMTAAILQLLFVILCLCHIGSCSRQFVMQRLATEHFDPLIPSSEYLDSMYWALSTMFSGAPPSQPSSLPEVWLSSLWIIMGALFVTAVTSTLAARLIEFNETQQDLNKKVQTLTIFMGQKKTPIWLSLAVHANFNKRRLAAEPVTERDMPFLHIVTPSLRAALREHQYASQFVQLPIFRIMSVLHPRLIRDLCFAASCSIFADAEDVFTTQQEMDYAYLLSSGRIRYSYRMSSIKEYRSLDSDMSSCVKPPSWICELALFVKWRTRGTGQAESTCNVLLLSTELFIKVVMSQFNVAVVAAAYARQLARVFLVPDTESFARCSDIDPGVDADVVVATMHTSIRGGLLSLPVLESLGQKYHPGMWNRSSVFSRWNKGILELEDEILAGKCHLVVGPEGANSISRVVRIAVLHLTDKANRMCAHLMQVVNGYCASRFNLPGCKVAGNDTAEETMQRFILEQLPGLAAAIRIVAVQTVIEMGASASYGISTKYIKTIHTAELAGEFTHEQRIVPQLSMDQQCFVQNSGFQMAVGETLRMATEAERPEASSSLFKTASSYLRGNPSTGPRSRSLRAPSEGSSGTTGTHLSSGELANALLGPQGKNRLFAVLIQKDHEPNSGKSVVEHQESQQTDRYSDINGQDASTLHLYSWIDKDEFQRLRGVSQKDVEEGLAKHATQHFTNRNWLELLDWRVKPDYNEPAMLDTESITTKRSEIVSHI